MTKALVFAFFFPNVMLHLHQCKKFLSLSHQYWTIVDVSSHWVTMICHFCPNYEIHDNAKMYQMVILVARFKTKDMKVDIEQGSCNLHVTGKHRDQKDNVIFQTRFDKCFALSENVGTTKITQQSLPSVCWWLSSQEGDRARESHPDLIYHFHQEEN